MVRYFFILFLVLMGAAQLTHASMAKHVVEAEDKATAGLAETQEIPERINTTRTYLRPLIPSDFFALFAILTDPENIRMSGDQLDRKAVYYLTRTRPFTDLAQKWNQLNFAIIDRETDALIGSVQLYRISPSSSLFHSDLTKTPFDRVAAIGYSLNKKYWGRGITTECVESMIQFGIEFLGIRTFHAAVFQTNVGSIKVLEKNGFIKTGENHSNDEHNDLYQLSLEE